MPRRVTILTLATAAAGVLAPAAAQAATTYTVDGAAAAGCDANNTCKTLTAAVAAVAAGDTIIVRPGTYSEPAKVVLTKANVLIQGTAGSTTITTASTTSGDPTLTLVGGDVVDGLTITPAANAGPGILVNGRDTTVKNTAIVRLAAGGTDTGAYKVDPTVGGGTNKLDRVTIVNGPAGATGQTAAAVVGNSSSSIAMNDSVVLSGANQGPAVSITGADTTGTPVLNTITRSSLVAGNPAGDALSVSSAATSAAKTVNLDTSVLLGGATSGSGIHMFSTPGAVAGMDSAGNITVVGTHVTIQGAKYPFVVNAAAGGQTAVGNMALTLDRSIVHGGSAGTVDSFVPALPLPLLPLTGVPNTAKATITQSDTSTVAKSANSGNATIVTTGNSNNTDAALFVNVAKQNIHLRGSAPVIDTGGPAVASESQTDIDGQARQVGPATDLGADEFVNRPPVAAVSTSTNKTITGANVTYDGSKSSDPDGGGVAKYHWVFGDGAIVETTTPTTTHAFAQPGLYNGSLTVYDTSGAQSTTVTIPTVAVVEGTPPVVTVTTPSRNGKYAITANEKIGSKIKRVLDPVLVGKVAFAGTATDQSGIKGVQISIRRVAVGTAKAPVNPKACVYLDGKTTFKSASCKKPVYFPVVFKTGKFSYKLKKALKVKPGLYELSVVAIDGVGVPSSAVVVRFRLK